MRLRIISKGFGQATRVINAETGDEVEMVTAVEWRCTAMGVAEANIELLGVEVDLMGESA